MTEFEPKPRQDEIVVNPPSEIHEGEVNITIGARDGKVGVEFGFPIKFLLLTPQQARKLAEEIRKASYRAE